MRFLQKLVFVVTLELLVTAPGTCEVALTLEQALTRAREQAPSVVSARARIEESRARLGAASLLRDPEMDAAAGRAISGDGPSERVDVGILQHLEIGGRRSARIGVARAEVASATAQADDVLRRAQREVASAFFRGLQAQERLALTTRAEGIAGEILETARRRYEAGDVALLDLNLARAAAARARSETHAARSAQSAALGELRVLLGFSPDQELKLRGEFSGTRQYDLADLLERSSDRPDIRALESELEAANAELRLGKALAWPDFGLGAIYEREEGQDFVLGAVRLTLPVFNRGQGVRAEAGARARRLALELEAARQAVRIEVRSAFAVYDQQRAAVEELARNALPLLEENETLSRESYEVGQISLVELLLVRREVLEIRNDYLSRLMDVSIASADLEASAGERK